MTRRVDDIAIYAAPVIFVVLWASGFVSGKYGLPYAAPFTFLSMRMIAVVVILTLIIFLMRPPWPDETSVRHSVVTGVLMHGCYLGGVFYSIYHGLPPALSALIVCLQPLVTSTVANRVLGETVILRQWIGLVLGLIGVFFVVYANIQGGAEAPVSAWVAAFIGLAGITAGTIFQKRFGGAIDWRPNFLIQYAAAGIIFCAGAILFERTVVYWNIHFIGALAWTVFVLSLGAIWLLYYLIARSAATRVTSLFYLVPPVTAIEAWIIFGDQLDKLSIAGMAACAAGVFLVNSPSRESAPGAGSAA
ncbi:MAG TPA: DMT family transporter [Xanthobacteraceae bacterium]|nr:DMT family transporter [Xanthobacteraceae bacterium]